MKLSEHIGKVTWSFADKALYILYGLVNLIQISKLEPGEFGLFFLMITMHSWTYLIADAFSLQAVVQFGIDAEDSRKSNTYSAITLLGLISIVSIITILLSGNLCIIFNQPDFGLVIINAIYIMFLSIPRNFCIKLKVRNRDFKSIFFIDLLFFGTMAVITFYYLKTLSIFSFKEMVEMYLAGTIASSLFAVLISYKDLKFGFKGLSSFREMFRFSVPMTFYSLFYSIPRQIDVYIIQYFFSTAAVGIYSSAKTLFRVFEEAANASFSIVYPAAVNLIKNKKIIELKSLLSKSISFMLISFIIILIFLYSGLSENIIKIFLPYKYYLSIDYFNVLVFSAIFMPFGIIAITMIAKGKPKTVLNISILSMLCSFLAYYYIGTSKNADLIPLGLLFFNFIYGVTNIVYMHSEFKIKFIELFRAVPDTYNFIKNRFGK